MELVDIRQALETGRIGTAMTEMTAADHTDIDATFEHRAILDAIRTGDAVEAAHSLDVHFGGLRSRIANL